MPAVTLGIEVLVQQKPAWLRGLRLGLLCNQAATDRRFRHSRDLIREAFPGQLTCLFSPQHGFFSEKQDNMNESAHMTDAHTGLPIFSLYGDRREPTVEMFDLIDVLLVDLFDVGTRVYTYIYTLAYCLQTAARAGKQVLVLDRPNPLGGQAIEGNLVSDDCFSFVGLFPIPMRHGLTVGEFALLVNETYGLGAKLKVIAMEGWQRAMYFPDTGLPWVFPSPNMPSFDTALVYPGQVIWEGTNISEGRGTTLPFELFGAPFFEQGLLAARLDPELTRGCILRPLVFEPTANKWQGRACSGFQIHVTDRCVFRPYRTSIALLQAVFSLYPKDFAYKTPPYEYEYERLPMDLILGDRKVRQALEQGVPVLELEESWREELARFDRHRQQFFLYS